MEHCDPRITIALLEVGAFAGRRHRGSVPKTERKPEHRPKPNPLGSERSRNSVRMVEFPKRPFLEQ